MKKELKIIDVEHSGRKCWYGGAYVYMFVYSKYHGNFILRGYLKEVVDYLKKNYTHYFYKINFYHESKYRGYWNFWKSHTHIFEPNKSRGRRKYEISGLNENEERIKFSFKRLPKKWIDKFDLF